MFWPEEGTAQFWPLVLAIAGTVMATVASLHAVVAKRETASVIGWVGLVWLSPILGPILYYCFGINRIQRKGQRFQKGVDRSFANDLVRSRRREQGSETDLPFGGSLASVVAHITGKPLLSGNNVRLLQGGEEAYPEMLRAIDQAEKSIGLCTYIFDNDRAGLQFIHALERAVKRGVEVRVLIDGVGSQYTKPSAVFLLAARGVPVQTFLPTWVPRMASYANLRNHRKLMVVDGKLAFTGGMNIRAGCRLDWESSHHVQDIHFRIEGPVVSQIQETFVTDWNFVTEEKLQGDLWFCEPERVGTIRSRGISDGPDTDLDNMRLVIMGAIASARHRVDVVTPYFLPDDAIINALNVAAMRGIRVRVVVPLRNNIRPVQWASMDPISHILMRGCQVYQTDPPFDHSKVFLVDDEWSLIGSSNWDPRSLRLNFEFNVECYGKELNTELSQLVERKIASARRLTLTDLRARPIFAKIRDGLARMAIPYL